MRICDVNGPAQKTGPNVQLDSSFFPLKAYADPANRFSAVQSDSDDRIVSSGTFAGINSTNAKGPTEEGCTEVYDEHGDPYHANGYAYRRNPGRNTPTNVNSIFSNRLFFES